MIKRYNLAAALFAIAVYSSNASGQQVNTPDIDVSPVASPVITSETDGNNPLAHSGRPAGAGGIPKPRGGGNRNLEISPELLGALIGSIQTPAPDPAASGERGGNAIPKLPGNRLFEISPELLGAILNRDRPPRLPPVPKN